jgi:serine protease Do
MIRKKGLGMDYRPENDPIYRGYPAPAPRPGREPRRIRATTAAALGLVTALAGGAVAMGLQTSAAQPAVSDTTAAVTTATTDTAPAQTGAVDVAKVAQDVGPAVVAIMVSGTINTASAANPFGGQYSYQGAGSGVIVDPSGLILTNRHVVGDASSVTVDLADGRQFDGTVKGVDTFTDLALVSIQATDLPTATLGDSSTIEVGEPAIAIGNPEGDLPGSVTAGVVSALERSITASDQSGMQSSETIGHLIQHDAAINPGNSGGPLLDANGDVIGINTAIAGNAQGIGFAIPINLAKPIVQQVEQGKAIERPYIGVYFENIDTQVATDLGLPVTSGALIGRGTQPTSITGNAAAVGSGVIAGGPAAQAGLQDGDIITAIDGQAIDAEHQLDVMLLQHEPGDTVTLDVLRNGATQQIQLTLGTRPAVAA